jgi:hypothetical protein
MKLIVISSIILIGFQSLCGAPKTREVYTVCEVLDQLASLNNKMISVRGKVIYAGHGSFLLGPCGSKLKVKGFTWPDVIYLNTADARDHGIEPDARAYEHANKVIRKSRPQPGDDVLMTFVGVLQTEDLAKLTWLNRLNQPIGNGFGPQNVAPAQLLVKTVKDPKVLRHPERKQSTGKN